MKTRNGKLKGHGCPTSVVLPVLRFNTKSQTSSLSGLPKRRMQPLQTLKVKVTVTPAINMQSGSRAVTGGPGVGHKQCPADLNDRFQNESLLLNT